MIDPRCLGPDVDRSKIDPDARITGASYLSGSQTAVAAGAVVHDARLHNAVVHPGASVVDSIVTSGGKPHTHRCDAAGRVVVSGAVPAAIGEGARVNASILTNSSVDRQSLVEDSSATECTIGPANSIRQARMILTQTLGHVTIVGPTELSEARLGHHATIDARGYFEGLFSNAFLRLRFDEAARRLKVAGTIDLPHVSRYGTNTINSTNSGKLLPQPDGVVRGLGAYGGLWSDPLLSHEQIELGPCCWVVPWTKVVGQSPQPHVDDEATVNDRLTTYLMPFSIAGVGGELTRGLVMPGELSVGLGPKQRRGAWTFTYAPGAVIAMVARLHAALPDGQKSVADTIVEEAIQTAIAMTEAMAAEYNVDLTLPLDQQPRAGWPRWVATTFALLRAHLEGQLWRFEGGRPCEWREENGCWRHPRFNAVLAVAPDALQQQTGEEALFECDDPVAPLSVPLSVGDLDEELGPGRDGRRESSDAASAIDSTATVHPAATIGPGCRIGPGTVVEAGAEIWRSSVDGSHVAAGTVVQRSVLRDARIGAESKIRGCRVVDSEIGRGSAADAASIVRSRLTDRATVSPMTALEDVESDFGAILGARCRGARIHTYFMSMHLAGDMAHVESLPTPVLVDGRTIDVPAIPMIGGGAVLRGTPEAPIRLECSFVGSNAIIESGVRLGFGCFILGRVPAGSGLLPLTLSTDEDPEHHQIGGALVSLPSTVITHFLSWAYQATGPEMAPAVAQLVRQSIERGIEAVEAEQSRRRSTDTGPTAHCVGRLGHGEAVAQDNSSGVTNGPFASLTAYTDRQLETGLANYRRSLDSGAWDLVVRDGQLFFAGEKGDWLERSGSALWKPHGPDRPE